MLTQKSCQLPWQADRKASSGFTLIEALVSLAVFSMAATYLIATFVSALEARERGLSPNNLYKDIQAVRMQLLLEPNVEAAEDGGDYPTLHQGEARWEAEIDPTEVVDLFRVSLQIEFNEPINEAAGTYTEELYLLRPTWSEADDRSDLLAKKKEEHLDSRPFDRF